MEYSEIYYVINDKSNKYMLLQCKTDIGPRAWYFARAFRRVQNIMPEDQYQWQYQFCTAIKDLFHGPWCILQQQRPVPVTRSNYVVIGCSPNTCAVRTGSPLVMMASLIATSACPVKIAIIQVVTACGSTLHANHLRAKNTPTRTGMIQIQAYSRFDVLVVDCSS